MSQESNKPHHIQRTKHHLQKPDANRQAKQAARDLLLKAVDKSGENENNEEAKVVPAYELGTSFKQQLNDLIFADKDEMVKIICFEKKIQQALNLEIKRVDTWKTNNKISEATDSEILIQSLRSTVSFSKDLNADIEKSKKQKPTENKAKIVQEKQINKQLLLIEEQITISNHSSVRITIQNLLKRFGKDELLKEKVSYLNYILGLVEEFERQSYALKELSSTIQKLNKIDPENSQQTVVNSKVLKKDFTLSINKESKKQNHEHLTIPLKSLQKLNQSIILMLDKKKPQTQIQTKSKKQTELEGKIKELERSFNEKRKFTQYSQQVQRYSSSMVTIFTENRQQFYRELELLRKNKKKSSQAPYNIIVKLYDIVLNSKKESLQTSNYLKSLGMVYQKKNLNSELLEKQIKRHQQKVQNNEIISTIKPNLESFINAIQQKERLSMEFEIKKLQKENQQQKNILEKQKSQSSIKMLKKESIAISETSNKTVEEKRREIQEKRLIEAELKKKEKEERQIEKQIEFVYSHLKENRLKQAKNTINLFANKFQGNIMAVKTIEQLNIMKYYLEVVEQGQNKEKQFDKAVKQMEKTFQKQRFMMNEKMKSLESYQNTIIELLSNIDSQQNRCFKILEDVRKDRKKVVLEKYQLLSKLQEPLRHWRSKSNISLTYSQVSVDSTKQSPELIKLKDQFKSYKFSTEEASRQNEQLLNLIKRVEKGGQWWKFIPKNTKNPRLKPLYNLLQSNRQNQLHLAKYRANEEMTYQSSQNFIKSLDFCLQAVDSPDYSHQDYFWQNKFGQIFPQQKSLEKLSLLLTKINEKFSNKSVEDRKNKQKMIKSYEDEIQKLTIQLHEIEKNHKLQKEKTMLSPEHKEESSSKMSGSLASSRRREKTRSLQKEESKSIKKAMQGYVEEEKKLLNKLQNLQTDNQSLRTKIRMMQAEIQELQYRERQLRQNYEVKKSQFFEKENNYQMQIDEYSQSMTKNQSRFNNIYKQLSHQLEIQKNQINAYRQQAQDGNKATSLYQLTIVELERLKQQNYNLVLTLEEEQKRSKPLPVLSLDYTSDEILKLQQEHQSKNRQYQNHIHSLKRSLQEKDLLVIEMQKEFRGQISNLKQKLLHYNSSNNTQDFQNLIEQRDHLYGEVQLIKNQLEQTKKLYQANSYSNSNSNNEQILILNQKIKQFEEVNIKQIQSEVNNALKGQEVHFNQFMNSQIQHLRNNWEVQTQQLLNNRVREIESYWQNIVLPERQKQWDLKSQHIASNTENIDLLINKKYEQWRNSYLPIIIDQKRSEWIKQFKQKEMEKILIEKQTQWENVRLLSIIKEERNNWMLENIVKEKKQIWVKQKQVQWGYKMKEVDNYWLNVVIPEKQVQWKTEVQHNVNHSTNNNEQMIARKYQEWKINYLPAVIQAEKQIWLQQFKQFQLSKILEQKQRQWESTRLLSVLKEQRNSWVVENIISQKKALWNSEMDSILQQRSNEIENYWESVIIPERKTQWESSVIRSNVQPQNNSFQLERKYEEWKNTYLPSIIESKRSEWLSEFKEKELARILEQKQRQWESTRLLSVLKEQRNSWVVENIISQKKALWNSEMDSILQQRSNEIENYWESVIIPERKTQWESSVIRSNVQPQNNSFQLERKYEEWKNTYLPSIIESKRSEWLSEFKEKELARILEQKQRQWESTRLLSVLKEQRNSWVVENIISQKKALWNSEMDSILQQRSNEIENYWESVIIPERKTQWESSVIRSNVQPQNNSFQLERKYEEWKNTYLPSIIESKRSEWLSEFKEKELARILEQKQRQWESTRLLSVLKEQRNSWVVENIISQKKALWNSEMDSILQQRSNEIENYWESVIIPERKTQWESSVIRSNVQPQNNSFQLERKYEEWKNTYLPSIIESKRSEWLSEFKEKELARILEQKQRQWESTRLLSVLKEQRNSWVVENIISQKKALWNSEMDSILQQRSNEIENYWESVIIPERKTQWESSVIRSNVQPQNNSFQLERKYEEWKNTYLPSIIESKRSEWLSEFKEKELARILEQKQRQWESTRLLSVLKEQRNSWVVENIISQKKALWNSEMDSILQQRSNEIENYWESVIIPERKTQWESSVIRSNVQPQNNSFQLERKYEEWKNTYLPSIIESKRSEWLSEFKEKELARILEQKQRQWESTRLLSVLKEQRNSWVVENIISQKKALWNSEMDSILQQRSNEIENYWESVIIPERKTQWESSVIRSNVQPQNNSFQLERKYEEWKNTYLPSIIESKRSEWLSEFKEKELARILEQKQRQWEPNIDQILRTNYQKWNHEKETEINLILSSQKAKWELQKQDEFEFLKSQMQRNWQSTRLPQLQLDIRHAESQNKDQLMEMLRKSLQSEFSAKFNQKVEDQRVKLKREVSENLNHEIQSLKRINQKQSEQIMSFHHLSNELDSLKKDNLSLKQAHYEIESRKVREINEIKVMYERRIEENHVNHLNVTNSYKKNAGDEAISSLERQITTLNSTIKTQDNQINFLKKSNESLSSQNHQIVTNLKEEVDKNRHHENDLSETKRSLLKMEYDYKFIKEKQETLKSRLDSKEQEIIQIKKRYQSDYRQLQIRVNSQREVISTHNIKIAELESILNLKNIEIKSLMGQIEKKTVQAEKEYHNVSSYKRQIDRLSLELKQSNHFLEISKSEKTKYEDEAQRYKLNLSSSEQKERMMNEENMKIKYNLRNYQSQKEKISRQYSHLQMQIDLKEQSHFEEIKKLKLYIEDLEVEKTNTIEKEFDRNEIQILNKINKDVTQITAVNRQLETKIVLLQNNRKITSFDSDIMNFFLLMQGEMDKVAHYLVQQEMIPNLQIYNRSYKKCEFLLREGKIEEYFVEWSKILKNLFHISVSSKTEEISQQAEQLMKLRDEMNDILDKQIQSNNDEEVLQVIDEYKSIFKDIKILLAEYQKTRDPEYLQLIYKSLAIEAN